MYKLFALLSLALLIACGWVVWDDYNSEWKRYQRQYLDMLGKMERGKVWDVWSEDQAGDGWPKLSVFFYPYEIKQIVVEDLGLVDRCTTCHLSYDDPRFSGEGFFPFKVEHPLKTHPDVSPHKIDEIGCTICHEGQGRATSVRGAAHEEIPHWSETMYPAEYVQAGCVKCHDPLQIAEKAPIIAKGYQLFMDGGCLACHKLGDSGVSLGPELTRIGAQFDIEYLVESMVDPAANYPTSVMPPFQGTEEELKAIVAYMKGLVGVELPLKYRPDIKLMAARALEEMQAGGAVTTALARGEELYAVNGCGACHVPEDQMVEGMPVLGPDISRIGAEKDKAYLRDSLIDPNKDLAKGFTPGMMPSYSDMLSEQDLNDLVEYLVSMK